MSSRFAPCCLYSVRAGVGEVEEEHRLNLYCLPLFTEYLTLLIQQRQTSGVLVG
jgi:hypothetical protein